MILFVVESTEIFGTAAASHHCVLVLLFPPLPPPLYVHHCTNLQRYKETKASESMTSFIVETVKNAV